MTLRFWLRAGLVAGSLVLVAGESFAQRGGRGGFPGSGGPPGGGGGFPGSGGPPGGGFQPGGGFPGGGAPPGGGFGGRGSSSSPEERWARFAGNADSIDLKDPKNAMMARMISQRYQVPPDGILRKSSYVEQVNQQSSGGPPGGMIMRGPGGPGGFPTAPGAPPGTTGSIPDGKIVIVSPGSDQTAPPSPGGSSGFPSRGDRGSSDRGGRGGFPGAPGGDPQQGGDRQGGTGQGGTGDPIEDPRPVVYRYGSQPKDAPSYFKDLDKDHDGQISLYEWRTGGKQVDDFVGLDLNNDGFLTVDENQRAIQIAAEEKEGGKKLDARSSGRGGLQPGGSGFQPGGGFGGRGGFQPGGGGFQPGGGFGGRGSEQPTRGGDQPPREERSSKSKKGR